MTHNWNLFINQTQLEIVVFAVSGSFALISVLLTFLLIFRHLKHYYEPHAQKPIIRILLMVPIYSVVSFLAILASPYALYFNLVRDCYEAYALYQFLCLLTHYYDSEGGELTYELVDFNDTRTVRSIGDQLKEQFERRRFPLPLCCFHYTPGNTLFAWIRRLALQYVFLKLLLSMVAIILALVGLYHAGSFDPHFGYFWISLILNLSALLAFYVVVMFYDLIAKTIFIHKPLLKFISLKILLFFCFWQTVVIVALYYFNVLPAFFGWTKEQSSDVIQNLLICIEMTCLAVFNFWAFSYRPYRTEPGIHTLDTAAKNLATDILNPLDIINDTKDAFSAKKHPHDS